jgi:hypothetical protein
MQNDPLTNAAFDNAMNVEAPRPVDVDSVVGLVGFVRPSPRYAAQFGLRKRLIRSLAKEVTALRRVLDRTSSIRRCGPQGGWKCL